METPGAAAPETSVEDSERIPGSAAKPPVETQLTDNQEQGQGTDASAIKWILQPKSRDMIHVVWGSGAPPCWAVLLCLKEKGLQYTDHRVQFDSGVLKSPEVLLRARIHLTSARSLLRRSRPCHAGNALGTRDGASTLHTAAEWNFPYTLAYR